MDAVNKQAIHVALALCMNKKNSKAQSETIEEKKVVPKVNLKEYNSSECFSIFMSRVNIASIHEQLLTELVSHALKEIDPDSNEFSYQDTVGRTFLSAVSNAERYFQRYLQNYTELCSFKSFNQLACQPPITSVNALLLAQFHVEVLLRTIVNVCTDHFFELYEDSKMHQRLYAFCELFHKASLQLIIDYDLAIVQQNTDLTAVSSLRFVSDGAVASMVESIEMIVCTLQSGQQLFKDWLVQSVAVIVDSEVNNFPVVIQNLVSLARSIE